MSWLVANTVVAAVAAAAVLAVGRWLRPAPVVMHVLWMLVLLKLVVPPCFEVPVWTLPGAGEPTVAVVDLGAAPLGVAGPAAVADGPGAWAWLGWVAGAGSVCVAAAFVLGCLRLRRRIAPLPVAPAWLQREVDDLARRLGVAAPPVCDAAGLPAPAIVCCGRVLLLVPVAVLAATPARGRAAVLAHELAHLRRRDHWFAAAEAGLAVLFWWHPLFWFVRRQRRLWAELACDAWALACVPDSTLDYAAVLIDAVARPDSAVRGPAVLASRPAAHAAFQQRLTMILNDDVPCRVARATWLPVAALSLGLLTVPVVAQEGPPPARLEIKVNGKDVGDLSAAERRALLQKLLDAEAPAPAAKKPATGKRAPKAAKPAPAPKPVAEPDPTPGIDVAEIRAQVDQALAEAKVEILADEDLRDLGIADEIVVMIDDLGAGKGIGNSIEAVVKAAMKGVDQVVVKELRSDPDLKRLGIADGLGSLVRGILGDRDTQDTLAALVRQAADAALDEVRVELRGDADLRRLGITEDLDGLLDAVLDGTGEFDSRLQALIEKSIQGAMREAGAEPAEAPEPAAEPEPAPPAKPAKTKKSKGRRAEIR